MNDYNFGNFVCMLREKKGFTQAQIAQLLGVTPAAVSKWENGSSKPRVEVLFRLADILEVRPEELLAGHYIVVEDSLDPTAVDEINRRYEYLRKIDSYNTTGVKLRRAGAFLLDWNIIGFSVLLLLGFCLKLLRTWTAEASALVNLFTIVFVLLYPAIFILRDFIFGGRSIGKRILGLVVLDRNTGEAAKGKKLFLRNLFLIAMQIDAIVLFISGTSIGDRVAQTVVVLEKEQVQESVADAPAQSYPQMINSYTPPKPVSKKTVITVVSVIVAAFLLFATFLVILITSLLEKQKNTEEYKMAYEYLVESSMFKEMEVSEEKIRLRSFSSSSKSNEEGNRLKTTEFGFSVGLRQIYVICHCENGEWYVCTDCTKFD